MTEEERKKTMDEWSDLENKIITGISECGNDKLMDMFFDWQTIRTKLNEDWNIFWNDFMEKIKTVEAKNIAHKTHIKQPLLNDEEIEQEANQYGNIHMTYEKYEVIELMKWVREKLVNPIIYQK